MGKGFLRKVSSVLGMSFLMVAIGPLYAQSCERGLRRMVPFRDSTWERARVGLDYLQVETIGSRLAPAALKRLESAFDEARKSRNSFVTRTAESGLDRTLQILIAQHVAPLEKFLIRVLKYRLFDLSSDDFQMERDPVSAAEMNRIRRAIVEETNHELNRISDILEGYQSEDYATQRLAFELAEDCVRPFFIEDRKTGGILPTSVAVLLLASTDEPGFEWGLPRIVVEKAMAAIDYGYSSGLVDSHDQNLSSGTKSIRHMLAFEKQKEAQWGAEREFRASAAKVLGVKGEDFVPRIRNALLGVDRNRQQNALRLVSLIDDPTAFGRVVDAVLELSDLVADGKVNSTPELRSRLVETLDSISTRIVAIDRSTTDEDLRLCLRIFIIKVIGAKLELTGCPYEVVYPDPRHVIIRSAQSSGTPMAQSILLKHFVVQIEMGFRN